jgi:hypothetical protein
MKVEHSWNAKVFLQLIDIRHRRNCTFFARGRN